MRIGTQIISRLLPSNLTLMLVGWYRQ